MNFLRISILILLGLIPTLSHGQSFTNAVAPYVVDFSKSHFYSDFQKSGIPFKEQMGRAAGSGRRLNFSNVRVQLKLPAGRTIEIVARDGILDFEENEIQQLQLFGDSIMPTDEAYEVMKKFHLYFGLNLDELDQWYLKSKNPERGSISFSMRATKSFPEIGVGILPSINDVYPCSIGLALYWNYSWQKDWSELRFEKEFQGKIEPVNLSCEPPSGKKYTREEAYAPLRKESDEWLRKFKQEHPEYYASNQATAFNPSPLTVEPIKAEPKQNFLNPKIVLAVILLFAILTIFLIFKLRK